MKLKKKEFGKKSCFIGKKECRERNGNNKKVCENGKEEKAVMREKEREKRRMNIYEFGR